MQRILVTTLILIAVTIAGCGQTTSGRSYSDKQARRSYEVLMGTLVDVRDVVIERDERGVGTVSGAAIGGVAGSHAGKGRGKVITTIIGALAGGIIGNKVEGEAMKEQGVELIIDLDNGKTIAVVQGKDPKDNFRVGDRVRVLSRGGETRVTR
ncbi:MAG: glycine zipper 2TM domain-containing protein [Gammaproteobacteria bacterium]|nr:MAG: glycine zipper 2TM domain-containing protein [Gammaproteobacteria bacterium]